MLQVTEVQKGYGLERPVLGGISLSLAQEDTLAIVGPSGCGKTTLLYLLCGLLRPDQGQVLLEDKPVHKPTQKIAIVLQDYGLFPWKKVISNVSLGLKIQSVPYGQRQERALEILREMGLQGREHDYPQQLSGGERQRVAIARAYAMEPKLMLMDEPFSSLDALTREKLQNTLLASWKRTHVPYILVTHSVEEAVFLGKSIMVLGNRPAVVKAQFHNPDCGQEGMRDTQHYFDLVREVRAAMEADG